MKKERRTEGVKEKCIEEWKSVVDAYFKMKKSPTIGIVLKLGSSIFKVILNILLKKLLDYIFPEV